MADVSGSVKLWPVLGNGIDHFDLEYWRSREANMTPIGRRLVPEEIVPLAILLASDGSEAVTGQAYNICGGVMMF